MSVTGHIHALGRPCRVCGYVAIPNRFYERNEKGEELPYEAALKRYKEYAAENLDDEANAIINGAEVRVVRSEVVNGEAVAETEKVCGDCGEGFVGYGRRCSKCRTRRSRGR